MILDKMPTNSVAKSSLYLCVLRKYKNMSLKIQINCKITGEKLGNKKISIIKENCFVIL